MRYCFQVILVLSVFWSNAYCQIDMSNIDIHTYYDSIRTEMVGKELSNIVFTDSLENQFDLESLKGKVVAINIWAFGCKPCIDEMPDLNELVEKYNNHVIFLSILGDGKGPLNNEIYRRIQKMNFKYATVSTDKKLSEAYGLLMVFPTHLIIGKNGKVLDLILGPNVEKIESTIKSDL
jgi:thiol-disulfide isomerase/thioredoxin